jgi:subtilase family serine protease
MLRRATFLSIALAFLLPVSAASINVGTSLASPSSVQSRLSGARVETLDVGVCDVTGPGRAGCLAVHHETMTSDGQPVEKSAAWSGFGPADIRDAYGLSASSSATVAIVDAFDDPTAEADLATYRNHYNLAPCTTSNGCFTKVDASGGTAYPRKDAAWAQEISLDVDMVSATCPSCRILLVEAKTDYMTDLAAAVGYAGTVRGVTAISNSYGGRDSEETPAYNQPGIAITASTGDGGYGVKAPASFAHVIAVGGTSLKRSSTGRKWTESAWTGAGSGCSTRNAKPLWQLASTQCAGKANTDVSAVADPKTGVAVYDSTGYQGWVGWMTFGGTSASSPIVASIYALSGRTAGYPASYTWGHASGLNDVKAGDNGTCTVTVWCHSATGWDGPTGLGTPNGTSAF